MPAAIDRARATRWLVRAVGGAIAATVLIGAAHTPLLRPWLVSAAARMGGCPVGGESMSPQARDAAQQDVLATLATDTAAASRPAFGFTLERTTLDEVRAWAVDAGVSCTDVLAGLRCDDVPASATRLGWAASDVRFGFDAMGRLSSVDASVAEQDPARALEVLHAFTAIVGDAGSPTHEVGEPTAAFLGAGPLRQVGAEFRFSDYRANVRATNLGHGRLTVRASVQAIRG